MHTDGEIGARRFDPPATQQPDDDVMVGIALAVHLRQQRDHHVAWRERVDDRRARESDELGHEARPEQPPVGHEKEDREHCDPEERATKRGQRQGHGPTPVCARRR